ncbi:hypothetical protein [Solimicrobium silvestre]|uniref:Uncharacterized protein n=1 Tax=Solimicrobium silvestre TaxID=2099400 RepID=A0A2S9GT79_9BURK|nr:hypothetical protein [Solimicrobium silvestre]PRC90913.1 hypothetical protein S2091_4406 [Solimicrobium silvestre]
MFNFHGRHLSQHSTLITAFISFIFCLILSACSGSSSSSGSPVTSGSSGSTPTPVTFNAAAAAVHTNLSQEAPHFNNSSVVTALNFKNYIRHFFPKNLSLYNEAIAADLGLSVIWDPENGSPPLNSDFSMVNQYMGGGFTPVGSTNNCTNGTITIPCNESLKNYMGQALDPNFQNGNGASTTIFGRLNNALTTICALSNLLTAAETDTDGLPVAGPLNVALPSDTTNTIYQPISSGGCGIPSSQAGQTLAVVVTAVSSSNYTKMLTTTPASNAVWLKLNASAGTLNVMTLEDQRPQGRYAIDRAIAVITGINTPGSGTTAFEYINMGSNVAASDSCYANGIWQCDFEFHRVYIDEANNVAYLISNNGSPGDAGGGSGPSAGYTQYTAVAQPSALKACSTGGTCAGVMAFSFSSNVFINSSDEYDGCINLVDRTLASSGSLSCAGSVTGTSVLANASAMVNSTRQVFVGDVVATLLNNTNANTTLAFNSAATIYVTPDSN